eukprot:TRINITY_DN4452_c0_g2_i1.p1 TRINITY_DN4452_c0_g2~~TRINITY_DN4452_c0_g2_i1.p1  ORF type:complete len:813 (+),score=280.00 TRINITY_DN4452_c0_g2_i1:227-2440(+)
MVGALQGDLLNHRSNILDTIFACVVAHPVKTGIYGVLVGLLNQKDSTIGLEIIQRLNASFEEIITLAMRVTENASVSLASGNVGTPETLGTQNVGTWLKLVLRFVIALVQSNVVTSASMSEIMLQLIKIAQSSEYPNRRDFFLHQVLMALPWAGKTLSARHAEELTQMMNAIQSIFDAHQRTINPCLKPMKSSEDYFTTTWNAIQKLRDANWTTSSIVEHHLEFPSLKSMEASPLPVPPTLKGEIKPKEEISIYPVKFPTFPRTIFRIFPESESENGIYPIDRIVIQDQIVDVLYFFSSNHKECLKQFEVIPSPIPIFHILTEAVFGQLFLLPNPVFKEIYYADIIADLCRTHKEIPPILGSAIDKMFRVLEEMDPECRERFAGWFSHHLTNFDMKWVWPHWDFILKLEDDGNHPQLGWVTQVLEKSIRLLYFERVQKTLPAEFHRLMPQKPAWNYKYEPEDAQHHAEAIMLFSKLQAKKTVEEIEETLQVENFASINDTDKLDILLSSVLKVGAKSFSHLLAVLERYLPVLQKHINSPERKMQALKCVKFFWEKSPQHIIILTDRLMTCRIIDSTAIVNWIFSAEELEYFRKSYVWEVLGNTLTRTLARTETLRDELKSAEDGLAKIPQEEIYSENLPEVRRVKDRRATLESVMREQKELFLIIFQRFRLVLSEYMTGEKQNFQNQEWYDCTLGHFREIGRKYHHELVGYLGTMESLLFTSVEPALAEVFQEIKNL